MRRRSSCNGQGDGADWTFYPDANELIDNQAKRLSALRNQIPNIVLLFGIAASMRV
jgi:hypothetical protein